MVVLVATVVAALALARAEGDLGEAAVLFGILAPLFGLVILLSTWESRSRGRKYEACWRTICHVLEGDHRHEGALLRGSWKGSPFEAFATDYDLGQYGGTVTEYRLMMPAECPGPAWRAERVGSDEAARWSVSADVWSVEADLVAAGLLVALEEAEQRTVHVRPEPRLSFAPRTGKLAYSDRSGEPPCAEDFVVHLDLLRRAVDVHAAAMASKDSHSGGGPRIRINDPPTWLQALWLPAALVGVAAGESQPWTFALLPVALAAPYLWRVRLRTHGGRPAPHH